MHDDQIPHIAMPGYYKALTGFRATVIHHLQRIDHIIPNQSLHRNYSGLTRVSCVYISYAGI